MKKTLLALQHLTWFAYFPPVTLFNITMACLILQWHTGVYEETFDVNNKIAQTTQSSGHFIVGKSSLLKKWQMPFLSGDTVQNLESPWLSGRVDSSVVGSVVIIGLSVRGCLALKKKPVWWEETRLTSPEVRIAGKSISCSSSLKKSKGDSARRV